MPHPLTRWLILTSTTIILVALTTFALSSAGQRPTQLPSRIAPARQYALKMAPAWQILLAGSPGLKSKARLVST